MFPAKITASAKSRKAIIGKKWERKKKTNKQEEGRLFGI